MTIKTPTCQVIRPDESYRGKQALTYFSGISAEMSLMQLRSSLAWVVSSNALPQGSIPFTC